VTWVGGVNVECEVGAVWREVTSRSRSRTIPFYLHLVASTLLLKTALIGFNLDDFLTDHEID
jgi:hypothetical protein